MKKISSNLCKYKCGYIYVSDYGVVRCAVDKYAYAYIVPSILAAKIKIGKYYNKQLRGA